MPFTSTLRGERFIFADLKDLLAAAGCNYVMAVPCADDVMLNYQSTSFHDVAGVRRLLNLCPAPEFAAWLEEVGVLSNGNLIAGKPARELLHGCLGRLIE